MLRFVMRHGLVRLIGGRAVPLMWAWDIAMLANRARRIPVVDRRSGAGPGAARSRAPATVVTQPALADASRPAAAVRGAPASSNGTRATPTRTPERADRRVALRTPC